MCCFSNRLLQWLAANGLHASPLKGKQALLVRDEPARMACCKGVDEGVPDQKLPSCLGPRGAAPHLPVLECQLGGSVHSSGQSAVAVHGAREAITILVHNRLIPEATVVQEGDGLRGPCTLLRVLVHSHGEASFMTFGTKGTWGAPLAQLRDTACLLPCQQEEGNAAIVL